MQAFDREYGLPDAYFVVAQTCRATLAPWAKEPVKAEDFVPYFAPPRQKQTVADHKANFARFARAPQPAPNVL